ncbi:predicted protein [Streptomyces sp. SPB78]|nr:predicted protein [Streptomyces sp. SPB78]
MVPWLEAVAHVALLRPRASAGTVAPARCECRSWQSSITSTSDSVVAFWLHDEICRPPVESPAKIHTECRAGLRNSRHG